MNVEAIPAAHCRCIRWSCEDNETSTDSAPAKSMAEYQTKCLPFKLRNWKFDMIVITKHEEEGRGRWMMLSLCMSVKECTKSMQMNFVIGRG